MYNTLVVKKLEHHKKALIKSALTFQNKLNIGELLNFVHFLCYTSYNTMKKVLLKYFVENNCVQTEGPF